MGAVVAEGVVTPIDRYLARQQAVTAVDRFARRHDDDLLAPGERWYAERLPVAAPGPGEQYAFRVDLDQCTGCKSCVAACHSLNGLDEDESWRSVGQLVSVGSGSSQTQAVPSGCHHCVDPACLSGCPTNAYDKDPFTGIVRHLDDQCIGCSYCELTCPYEVPRLNHRLGVVRKCDMCADRLADGEAPACVQACPTGAITITVVDQGQAVLEAQSGALVPGAPASAVTVPTTQYVSARGLSDDLVSADRHAVHLSRSHPPLAIMLVLTQLSVGAFVSALAADRFVPGGLPIGGAAGAALAGLVALSASVLHLGRPAMAWRAVLGVGHSWLSREIVAFGLYAALATTYAGASASDAVSPALRAALGGLGALVGVTGVVCSALIYVATRRTWWGARHTLAKFAGSAAVTGPLLLAAVVIASGAISGSEVDVERIVVPAAAVALVAAVVKLGAEALVLWPGRWRPDSDMAMTARLLTGPLAVLTRWRFALGAAGGLVGPVAVIAAVSAPHPAPTPTALLAVVVLVAAVGGELIERYQFFVASVTPRMPGGFRR